MDLIYVAIIIYNIFPFLGVSENLVRIEAEAAVSMEPVSDECVDMCRFV